MRVLVRAAALACLGLLAGCGTSPLAVGGPSSPNDDDDGLYCEGTPGLPQVFFIADDESHVPLTDGAEYFIERRPQGDVTAFVPLLFTGIDGGTILEDFALVFRTDDGEELGARRAIRFQVPCEDDGETAAHWYEVFFGNPSIPPSDYEGVTGVFSVGAEEVSGDTLVDLQDEIHVTLRAGTP
ncbi:MAG: hypothetical protein KDA24_16480 [Deltaproteobacteria bacterium]|nr:hypothetical protein [Deltaproteobacteria bacterium]